MLSDRSRCFGPIFFVRCCIILMAFIIILNVKTIFKIK